MMKTDEIEVEKDKEDVSGRDRIETLAPASCS